MAVIVFATIVYTWLLRPAYKPYLHYFYILSISSFVWPVTYFFLQYLVFNKNKKILFQMAIISIAVAIGINYIASALFNINWLAAGQVVINLSVLFVVLLFNKKLRFFA
jgi:O-antigen/teichoic acid export membrane protein